MFADLFQCALEFEDLLLGAFFQLCLLCRDAHGSLRQLARLLRSLERVSPVTRTIALCEADCLFLQCEGHPQGVHRPGVSTFLDDLSRHESAENGLLQKLVVCDVGGGD